MVILKKTINSQSLPVQNLVNFWSTGTLPVQNLVNYWSTGTCKIALVHAIFDSTKIHDYIKVYFLL